MQGLHIVSLPMLSRVEGSMLTNRRHRRESLHLTDYRTNIRERRIIAVGGRWQPIVLRDELVDLGLEAALHVGVSREGKNAG